MSRVLWGEFEDDDESNGPIRPDEINLPNQKEELVQKAKEMIEVFESESAELTIDNPIVTQTVEVMKQTEILQSLIDTYSNKSDNTNYLPDSCQVIPEVDFPPENSEYIVNHDKFSKPLWFIPPIETDFSRGIPVDYPTITTEIAKAALKRSAAGLGRIAGYAEASEKALHLLVDSTEEFVRSLLQTMKQVQAIDMKDKSNILDIEITEKAYQMVTHSSLLCLHDYYKNEIIGRNLAGIQEFKEVYNEYDKLRRESQNIQKSELKEEDVTFMDISGLPQSSGSSQQKEGPIAMELGDADGGITPGILDYLDNSDMADTTNVEEQSAGGTSFE